MMTAEKFMTKEPLTISQNASVLEAYRLMYLRQIRHLPVVDEDDTLIGFLSDRNIFIAMDSTVPKEPVLQISLSDQKKVSDYMSVPVYCVQLETQISSILEELLRRKVSAVPVVDEKLKVLGIITTEDFLKFLLQRLVKDEELLKKPLSFFLPNTLY